MKSSFFIIVAITAFLSSCIQNGTPNLLPELSTCDSAVIFYYKTPGNPRFFTMIKVYEPATLKEITFAVNKPAHPTKNECSTQGKVYMYGDKGEVFVLYFTFGDSCKSLNFIKTGEKYEVNLPDGLYKTLQQLKSSAYEPVGQN
jgi:hypothetical protein